MDGTGLDVTLVRWPAEAHRLEVLRAAGTPRLVMVEADADPPDPEPIPGLEDWVRMPAPAADVRHRVDALLLRAASSDVLAPIVTDDGRIRFRGRAVVVSPTERQLFALLAARPGVVVSRETLVGVLGASSSDNALDAAVSRLRRRLEPLAVAVRSVRRRGYVLELRADGADT